ncbi:DNA-methyltransferase [Aneurinibacillus aneurinilyticus]|uniref:DNA-methyltransferase n=1 Tax=Aneurinibacillus aneurinilyticus TaxID=1391 RepID=UPI00366C79C7
MKIGAFDINTITKNDCMKAMPLMPSNSVDLILTDIPYGNVSKNGEERAKYSGQLRKLDKEDADVETFDLIEFLDECYRLLKGSIYIFCGIEQMSTVFDYFDSKTDMTTRQCIWHKTNPSPVNGQHYWIHAIENCVYAKKRKTTFNQHCKHNVWDFPAGRGKIHPTQKPLGLFKYLIESSTFEGEVVFDPCIGSGTTAVAARELNRQYIGFDISEEYVGKANERLSAIHIAK